MGTASSCPRVEVDQARLGDRILSANTGKIAAMPATFNCYTTLRNSAWARKVPTLLIYPLQSAGIVGQYNFVIVVDNAARFHCIAAHLLG